MTKKLVFRISIFVLLAIVLAFGINRYWNRYKLVHSPLYPMLQGNYALVPDLSSINRNDPMNSLDENFSKNELNNKFENVQIEPNIIPVNDPNDPNNCFWIYDNFEIIKKEIITLFVDSHRMGYQNYLECNLGEGKVI